MAAKFLALGCSLFFWLVVHAQERVLRGQMQPKVAGCIITIKGTGIRAVSDSSGSYVLTIPDSIQLNKLELIYDANGMYTDKVNLEKDPAFDPHNTTVNLNDPAFQQTVRISRNLRTTMITKAPDFPFPPPAASTQDVMDKDLLKNLPTLGAFNHKLDEVLESLGYFEKSYYAVPNGFALVTRLERRKEDEPVPYDPPLRWEININSSIRSVKDYLLQLFTAPKGFFRVITFVVTDNLVRGDVRKKINRDEALSWFKTGTTVLPSDIARLPLGKEYDCTILIYEFEKTENTEARFITSSPFPGKLHLHHFYKTFSGAR